MNKIWTVLKFEFLTFAKSGTFIVVTAILGLIALIGPAVPVILSATNIQDTLGGVFGGGESTIIIVDTANEVDNEIFAQNLNLTVHFWDDIAAAREAVGAGEFDFALHIHSGESYSLFATSTGIGIIGVSSSIDAAFREQHRIRNFADRGIAAAETAEILAFEPSAEVVAIGATGEITAEQGDPFMDFVLIYVMGFLIYFLFLMAGQYLVLSVVREKSTKTMEVLITSAKSDYLITGKVLGVSALAFLQLVLITGLSLLSLFISGIIAVQMMPPEMLNPAAALEGLDGAELMAVNVLSVGIQPNVIIFAIVFFVLGFLIYAYLYAALGSTISRMEDMGNISTIPVLLILVGYMAMTFGIATPTATWLVVLSYIPFFSPFIMLMRIAANSVDAVGIGIAIVLQIAAVFIMAWLSSRIYRMGTLMYGNKPKIKTIFAAFVADMKKS